MEPDDRAEPASRPLGIGLERTPRRRTRIDRRSLPRRLPTMWSSRQRSPRRSQGRCCAAWAALLAASVLPSVGCQVEYAGMTLPSGKYMHDDVQYFIPGPAFPWANTQAATQRARMQAMGIEPGPGATGPLIAPVPPGMIPPEQNRMGRPTDINASPLSVQPVPGVPGEGFPGPGGAPPAGVVPPAAMPPGAVPAPPPGAVPPPGVPPADAPGLGGPPL